MRRGPSSRLARSGLPSVRHRSYERRHRLRARALSFDARDRNDPLPGHRRGDEDRRGSYETAGASHRRLQPVRKAGQVYLPPFRAGSLGHTQVEALCATDADLARRRKLARRLDPLRDQRAARLLRERHHGRHERAVLGLGIHPANEARVELHNVRLELEHVVQAREPGARVVDREPHAARAEPRQRRCQRRIVADRHVFGDLEDDAARGHARQHLGQRLGTRGRGRYVDVQRRRPRELSDPREGRVDRGELQGLAEADGRGVGEPPIRGASVVEAGEGFDADDFARHEVDDRLERHVDPFLDRLRDPPGRLARPASTGAGLRTGSRHSSAHRPSPLARCSSEAQVSRRGSKRTMTTKDGFRSRLGLVRTLRASERARCQHRRGRRFGAMRRGAGGVGPCSRRT